MSSDVHFNPRQQEVVQPSFSAIRALCNGAPQMGLLAAPMFELLPLYTPINRQDMDCRIMSQGLLRLDPYLTLVYTSTYCGFPELWATPLLWIRVLLAVA